MPSTPVALFVLGVSAALWAVVTPLWAPFLAADRIRALFALGPTGSVPANYLLTSAAVTIVHVASFLALVGLGVDVTRGVVIFEVIAALNVAIPALAWATSVIALPALGRRWDPTGHGLDTAALLAAGAVWYGIIVSGLVAVGTFVLFALYFPG